MKTLIIIFALFPMIINAQKDTLAFKNGKSVPCTITLDNDFTIFYKDKKDFGDQVQKSKLQYYSVNGKRMSMYAELDKSKLTDGKILVNGIDINSLDIKYCEIIGFDFEMKNSKIIINLDYGQEFVPGESMKIETSDGKSVVFNSMVNALNFMEKNGWDYVNQYAMGGNAKKVYRILLKRKLTS